MSKKFKTQNYFRHPRLGTRWRRPKGHQSKLRRKKAGSGKLVSMGYGTQASLKNTISGMKYMLVSCVADMEKTDAKAVIISSGVGGRKTEDIARRAKELGIKVLNMKKVKKAEKLGKRIAEKRAAKKETKKKEKKKGAADEKEEKKPKEEKPAKEGKEPEQK